MPFIQLPISNSFNNFLSSCSNWTPSSSVRAFRYNTEFKKWSIRERSPPNQSKNYCAPRMDWSMHNPSCQEPNAFKGEPQRKHYEIKFHYKKKMIKGLELLVHNGNKKMIKGLELLVQKGNKVGIWVVLVHNSFLLFALLKTSSTLAKCQSESKC